MEPGQRINERYRILQKIGEGGMAAVYLAEDENLSRQVAVKMIRTGSIPPDQLEKVLERFCREAKNLAKLSDMPGVVTLLDFGVQDETPFLVMSLMAGGTLKDRMKSLIPVEEAADILLSIAKTLALVHSKGMVHGEIQPSNILADSYGNFFLTDFGIAKAINTEDFSLTGTEPDVGVVAYLAPEQWHAKPVSQSDLYSLGVIFYQMITGRRPFEGQSASDVFLKMMTEDFEDPRHYVSALDEPVVDFFKKTFARNIQDRHVDAEDFLQGLLRIKTSTPIRSDNVDQKPGKDRLSQVHDETWDEYLEQLNLEESISDEIGTLKPEIRKNDQQTINPNPIESAEIEVSKANIPSPLPGENSEIVQEPDIGKVPVSNPASQALMDALINQKSEETRPVPNIKNNTNKNILSVTVISLGILILLIAVVIGASRRRQFELEQAQTNAAALYSERTQTQRSLIKQTKTAENQLTRTAEAAERIFRTQTARVRLTATQQAIDSMVKEVEARAVLIVEDESGELVHNEDGYVATYWIIEEESNFILEVEFTNPYNATYNGWDVGTMFRHYGGNDQYRLIINSDFAWELLNWTEDGTDVIQSGNVVNLNVLEGETNRLKLIVENETGYFFINNEYISDLDLSARMGSGSILLGTGFYGGNEVDGKVTLFQNLNVWEIWPKGESGDQEQSGSIPSIILVEKEDGKSYIHIIDQSQDLDYFLGPVTPLRIGTWGILDQISISPNNQCFAIIQSPNILFARVGDQYFSTVGNILNFSMYKKGGGLYDLQWLSYPDRLEVSEYFDGDSLIIDLGYSAGCSN